MIKTQTLGNYGRTQGGRGEYLALSFSPLSAPLRSRWRNNGLSADFLGDYITTFLPMNDSPGSRHNDRADIRHAVTYIANEFLENAMKYHERSVDIPIGIRLELTSERIAVSASNCTGAAQGQRYMDFANNLLQHDAGELLLEQLEKKSGSEEAKESCVGLLTMISDYGAQLGWHFEVHPDRSELLTVTTSAVLPVVDLEGVEA